MGIIPPRRVFVSYAHSDNESTDPNHRWLDRLLEMIAPLHMMNEVGIWTDKDLNAGDQWKSNLESVINTAEVAVLLVSPAYLASKFIRESELPTLLYRSQNVTPAVDIISVVLRHCMYRETAFIYKRSGGVNERVSLDVFQSINSPDEPLESLSRSQQDFVLLALARRMYAAYKAKAPVVR